MIKPIVSNTSPLTNLAAIGKFDILEQLFGEIHIPHGVWHELNAYQQRWPGSNDVENARWVFQHVVKNQTILTILHRDLDMGESQAIALALEINAQTILLDEKEARRIAQSLGLRPFGTVGILLKAKSNGILSLVRPALDDLRHIAGFYLSQTLYHLVLQAAGENN